MLTRTGRWLLIIGVIAIIAASIQYLFFPHLGRGNSAVGKPVPEFYLPAIDSKKLYSEDIFKNHVSLMNFFAVWCYACEVEYPTLLALKKAGVRIIGIDYRDNLQNAKLFFTKNENAYEHVLFDQNGQLGNEMFILGTPTTFVVDQKGIVRYQHTGVIRPQDVKDVILPELKALQK